MQWRTKHSTEKLTNIEGGCKKQKYQICLWPEYALKSLGWNPKIKSTESKLLFSYYFRDSSEQQWTEFIW